MDDPLKGTPDLSTPSPKRRKLVAVQPTPRASDYLAAFGAQRTPTSVTKMSKQNDGARALRGTKPAFSYAESDGSDPATPESSPNTSDYGESKGSGKTGKASIDVIDLASDSEEEISEEEEDELDTIQGKPLHFVFDQRHI